MAQLRKSVGLLLALLALVHVAGCAQWHPVRFDSPEQLGSLINLGDRLEIYASGDRTTHTIIVASKDEKTVTGYNGEVFALDRIRFVRRASGFRDSPLYVGAGVGRSRLDSQCEGILDSPALACDAHYEKATSSKLFLGFQFTRYVALELSHAWLGTFSETGTYQSVTIRRDSKPLALVVQAVGTLPLDSNWAIQGRLGPSALRVQTTEQTSGFSPSPGKKEYDFGYVIGAGLQYGFDKNVGVRAEIERHACCYFSGGEWIVYFTSVSVVYRFR